MSTNRKLKKKNQNFTLSCTFFSQGIACSLFASSFTQKINRGLCYQTHRIYQEKLVAHGVHGDALLGIQKVLISNLEMSWVCFVLFFVCLFLFLNVGIF